VKFVFIDTETTGLDPTQHELWELALIVREDNGEQWEYERMVRPNLSNADPNALRINGFYDRFVSPSSIPTDIASFIAKFTSNATLVGANPSFDASFIDKFLRKWNYAPAWKHRMICVESLVAGALRLPEPVSLLKSAELMGIEVNTEEAHTASYDAHLAMQVYDAVMED